MNFSRPYLSNRNDQRGFTLVEIAIAVGILATVMVVTIGLLSPGLKASRTSASQTITGVILEDVHERLEGHELKEGDVESAPFYYDDQGMFIAPDATEAEKERRVYRAEAKIIKPSGENLPDHTTGLMGVVIDLYWPINPTSGELLNDEGPGTSVTYYLTTLTGVHWPDIDPSYVPKIEF